MTFTGTAKGKFFFDNEDGERKALTATRWSSRSRRRSRQGRRRAGGAEEGRAEAAHRRHRQEADAWYTVGHDDAAQFKGTSRSMKGVERAFFDDEDSNRISATLEVEDRGLVERHRQVRGKTQPSRRTADAGRRGWR
jgi:hypothetical protein